MVPPVAYYYYYIFSKIPFTSAKLLFVKNSVQCPLSNSPILYELGLKEFYSSVPKATAITLFFPIKNFESLRVSLKALKLFVVIF